MLTNLQSLHLSLKMPHCKYLDTQESFLLSVRKTLNKKWLMSL